MNSKQYIFSNFGIFKQKILKYKKKEKEIIFDEIYELLKFCGDQIYCSCSVVDINVV